MSNHTKSSCSGYTPCACRDCMEIAFDGGMCHDCVEHGCSGVGECSVPGGDEEWDAYNAPESKAVQS